MLLSKKAMGTFLANVFFSSMFTSPKWLAKANARHVTETKLESMPSDYFWHYDAKNNYFYYLVSTNRSLINDEFCNDIYMRWKTMWVSSNCTSHARTEMFKHLMTRLSAEADIIYIHGNMPANGNSLDGATINNTMLSAANSGRDMKVALEGPDDCLFYGIIFSDTSDRS